MLQGDSPPHDDPLYDKILQGINLERPFAEHRRPFPVVEAIQSEQALWLLGCLAIDRSEVPESAVVPYLKSANHRDRIDAAVLLGMLGFGAEAADTLDVEATAPYPFQEIMGIGKSHLDPNFRDKCYLVMALAHQVHDVERLQPFADPRKFTGIFATDWPWGWATRPAGRDFPVESVGDQRSRFRRFVAKHARHCAYPGSRTLAGRPWLDIDLPRDLPFGLSIRRAG